jgi:hypothetical protein
MLPSKLTPLDLLLELPCSIPEMPETLIRKRYNRTPLFYCLQAPSLAAVLPSYHFRIQPNFTWEI